MTMLTLQEGGIRALMHALLISDVFDGFLLRGCVVQSFARFDIDGTVFSTTKGTEGHEKQTNYNEWRTIKPYVYNIIKGNKRPRFLKIVFACPGEILKGFPDAQTLFINITFDKDAVLITTGCSLVSWSKDKSTEHLWDDYVTKFFVRNNISVKEHGDE